MSCAVRKLRRGSDEIEEETEESEEHNDCRIERRGTSGRGHG